MSSSHKKQIRQGEARCETVNYHTIDKKDAEQFIGSLVFKHQLVINFNISLLKVDVMLT